MHKCDGCMHMKSNYMLYGRRIGLCTRFDNLTKAELAYLVSECPFVKKEAPVDQYKGMMYDTVHSDCTTLIEALLGIQKPKLKKPDFPIWKETDYFWIVVTHRVGPLKLLEIVLKEGYGDA